MIRKDRHRHRDAIDLDTLTQDGSQSRKTRGIPQPALQAEAQRSKRRYKQLRTGTNTGEASVVG